MSTTQDDEIVQLRSELADALARIKRLEVQLEEMVLKHAREQNIVFAAFRIALELLSGS